MRTETDSRTTKERILDAAERRFADQGFSAASLRGITADAEVNLAAVNYHFGSKETLIEAVFARRLEPMNRERIHLLDAAQRGAEGESPALEAIIEAFIAPPLRMSRREDGGAVFMRLLGHAMNQPSDHIRKILAGQFREVADRFASALGRALPDVPDAEIFWRMLFMVGSMAHTMALADQLRFLSKGLCDASDVDEVMRHLLPFLSAGLRSSANGELKESS